MVYDFEGQMSKDFATMTSNFKGYALTLYDLEKNYSLWPSSWKVEY